MRFFISGRTSTFITLWSTPGQPWVVEDVTASSGAPLATSGSALAAFENNRRIFVKFFIVERINTFTIFGRHPVSPGARKT